MQCCRPPHTQYVCSANVRRLVGWARFHSFTCTCEQQHPCIKSDAQQGGCTATPARPAQAGREENNGSSQSRCTLGHAACTLAQHPAALTLAAAAAAAAAATSLQQTHCVVPRAGQEAVSPNLVPVQAVHLRKGGGGGGGDCVARTHCNEAELILRPVQVCTIAAVGHPCTASCHTRRCAGCIPLPDSASSVSDLELRYPHLSPTHLVCMLFEAPQRVGSGWCCQVPHLFTCKAGGD